MFQGPADFNAQLTGWLTERANQRLVRSTGARPTDRADEDRQAMLRLPRAAPAMGLDARVRLARDYYVRVDGNDYSADPRFIGRLLDVRASLTEVRITCDGEPAGVHVRSWQAHQTVTDPAHVETAGRMRQLRRRQDQTPRVRAHEDGHRVQLRALTDYDDLFGVDFQPTPTTTYEKEAQ